MMSLRQKLFSALITVAILPLVGVAVFVLATISEHNADHVTKHIQENLLNIATQMSGRIENYKSEVRVLSHHPLLKTGQFTQARQVLVDYLKLNSDVYEKFIIGDSNGYFYNTHGGNPNHQMLRTFDDSDPESKPRSIITRDYWKHTLGSDSPESNLPYVSNPMISYTTGTKQLVIAHPIIDKEGKKIGLLGAALPWSLFDSWLTNFEIQLQSKTSFTVNMVLISRDGYYWYHWDKNKIINLKTNSDGEFIYDLMGEKASQRYNILNETDKNMENVGRAMMRGDYGIKEVTTEQGVENWFYAPIQSAHYSIALVVDHSAMNQLTQVVVLQIATIFIVAFMLALLLTIYLSEHMSHPVKHLASKLNRILLRESELKFHLDDFCSDKEVKEVLLSCLKSMENNNSKNQLKQNDNKN